MPSLNKLPRRVGLLVKKRTLRRRGTVKKKPRNPIYEKLKNNNVALARALSKEKQECQYLYTQNIKLTGQVQDLQTSLNKRNEIISLIRKNSSESLKLLVQTTNLVTNNILSSKEMLSSPQLNIINNQSLLNSSKRESMRRSTGKSPARGVVQPMVSGHTITKPVINLSRINMQRIVASPNMSDIEETSELQTAPTTTLTPVRIVERQRRSDNRRLSRRAVPMPERICLNPPPEISDEEEEEEEVQPLLQSPSSSSTSPPSSPALSESVLSRRVTDSRKRKSATITSNNSLTTNNQSLTERFDNNSFNNSSINLNKSPRVELQDVGLLMQNSQSFNVKRLLENVGDVTTTTPPSSARIREELLDDSPTYGLNPLVKKQKKNNETHEDPLEGPSWLLNNSENIYSPEEPVRHDDSYESDDITENIQTLPLSRFAMVTTQRGQPTDDDDFTMVINPPPVRRQQQQRLNGPLEIEEFRIPELEPFINPDINIEPEPEMTTTIQIVPQQKRSLMQSMNMFNHSLDNSMTVPIVPEPNFDDDDDDDDGDDDDDDDDTIIRTNYHRKGGVKSQIIESSSESESSPTSKIIKSSKVKRKTMKRKDPSSAKVVLEKLSNVATPSNRSLSPDPRRSSYNISRRISMGLSETQDPGSDSDSSNVSTASKTSSRPRRLKAPVNLKEPNIRKKLRR